MRLYHSCQSYCKAPLSATAKAAVAAATSAASATKRSSATASTAEGTSSSASRRESTSSRRIAFCSTFRNTRLMHSTICICIYKIKVIIRIET